MAAAAAAMGAAQAPLEVAQEGVPRAAAPEQLVIQGDLAVARDAPGLDDVPGPEILEPEGVVGWAAFRPVVRDLFQNDG